IKAPFTVIPPVSRLEPAQEKVLRIIHTKGVSLPDDRESVFWLNIKNIPPSASNKAANSLEIAVKTRIKLFWRPKALENVSMKNPWQHKVTLTRNGQDFTVNNPTPYYVIISNAS
ncbi:fimbria/pilus periplasmic chaperone, partial [Escherichia coli]|uniref:fimbria/pilus periplasmic chaperone n=1 Tax=Escherichia coli TaxID=562 RepID=UPI00202BB455